MRDYRKQQLWFRICDFFKECKGIIIIAFIITLVGFALACATLSGKFQDTDIVRSVGKIILRFIFTLTVCYALIFFSSYNRYMLFLGVLSFVFYGYRSGIASYYLVNIARFSGIISLIFVYIPLFLVSFLLLTFAMSISLGYSSTKRCGRISNTCINVQKTILINISAIYLLNILLCVIYLLIFGNIFNAVCIIV